GINRLDPAEVPVLLHRLGTLQAFGIPLPTSPAPQANGRVSGQTAAAQPSAVRPTVRPSGPAGSQVATAVTAQDPGAMFRQQVERRAAASAVAPMGVGAAPARRRRMGRPSRTGSSGRASTSPADPGDHRKVGATTMISQNRIWIAA